MDNPTGTKPSAITQKKTSPEETTGTSLEILTSEGHRGEMGAENGEDACTSKASAAKPGFRFWAIIIAISFAGLLTALEATITSTALPTIVADLGGAESYTWIINGYFLSMTALQPLYGQLANVFGRRYPTIIAVATFTFGSGICGGANSTTMLIAGRVVQGIGAAGINVLVETIICDLVPLRERGNYMALIFGMIAVGTALGPLFGGLIVQHSTWRWAFYLNLPVGGAAFVLLTMFLHVQWKKSPTFATSLSRIDWLGNAIFIGSISSILIALSWAGTLYAWSSFRIIAPLTMGFVGLGCFFAFEGSRFCAEPMMPLHLFSNRTSATSFILTFFHSLVTIAALYFLPVYFQGVLGSTPGRSGVQLLPTILALVPFAAAAGAIMAKSGRYRPIHHAGYAMIIIGFGLFSVLDESSSTAEWVIFQLIEGAGAGLVIPTLLPAVLAPLTEADTALATATWSFVRSFGLTWGTAISSAIFNNRFDAFSGRITDPTVVAALSGGQAYEHATKAYLETLTAQVREQVISVFSKSLKQTWEIIITFGAVGFLLVIIQREVPLRKDLETEYGIEEKGTKEPPSI